MRRRMLLVTIGFMLVVVGALWAFSSAGPTKPVLPPPVVVATPNPTMTPSPSSSSSSPVSAPSPETAQPLPRGNPVKVTVSRRDKRFISERISGSVGLTNEGSLRVLYPPGDSVGWYKQGRWQAKPGYPGPSVLVAHISYHGKPGPFWLLPEVAKGDRITVMYDSGDTVTFVVTAVEHTEKVDLPVDKIWTDTLNPVLWLVTCDPATPFHDGHYAGNVLVYAGQLVG